LAPAAGLLPLPAGRGGFITRAIEKDAGVRRLTWRPARALRACKIGLLDGGFLGGKKWLGEHFDLTTFFEMPISQPNEQNQ
jgi:hypothetical protein